MTEIQIPPRAGKVQCAPGTMDQPGRNHPGLANWLLEMVERELGFQDHYYDVADPFVGAGFWWCQRPGHVRVHGCDLREEAMLLARQNGVSAVCERAERWTPPVPPALIAFSPPYPNCEHSSGKSEKQIAMRMKKHLMAMETCPGTRNLLPVFLQVASYRGAAPVAVIVRNWIEKGREVDWVSEVEQSMRFAGLGQVERFWRRLLPGPTTQWKLKSGAQKIWVDKEIVLVARGQG